MNVLEMIDVTRVHRTGAAEVHALEGVNLSVTTGEFVAVMGPSGSGKSTLLNLAGALDSPTQGTVRVCGIDLAGCSATQLAEVRRRDVGFVFQDFNLLPSLSTLDNVAFPLELDGTSRGEARREAQEALERVEIPELADRFPAQISGGQAQRVAIARALVGPRRLLLADEPTGALDSRTGEAIMRAIRSRVDESASVLLVTHEPRFAAWADRTIFLADGRVVDTARASLDELVEP